MIIQWSNRVQNIVQWELSRESHKNRCNIKNIKNKAIVALWGHRLLHDESRRHPNHNTRQQIPVFHDHYTFTFKGGGEAYISENNYFSKFPDKKGYLVEQVFDQVF